MRTASAVANRIVVSFQPANTPIAPGFGNLAQVHTAMGDNLRLFSTEYSSRTIYILAFL